MTSDQTYNEAVGSVYLLELMHSQRSNGRQFFYKAYTDGGNTVDFLVNSQQTRSRSDCGTNPRYMEEPHSFSKETQDIWRNCIVISKKAIDDSKTTASSFRIIAVPTTMCDTFSSG